MSVSISKPNVSRYFSDLLQASRSYNHGRGGEEKGKEKKCRKPTASSNANRPTRLHSDVSCSYLIFSQRHR